MWSSDDEGALGALAMGLLVGIFLLIVAGMLKVVAPLFSALVQASTSREREFLADATSSSSPATRAASNAHSEALSHGPRPAAPCQSRHPAPVVPEPGHGRRRPAGRPALDAPVASRPDRSPAGTRRPGSARRRSRRGRGRPDLGPRRRGALRSCPRRACVGAPASMSMISHTNGGAASAPPPPGRRPLPDDRSGAR